MTLCGYAAAAAKSLQSYPTLCDPIDGSPPGSPVPGILQARTLEWIAISFSNAWKWKVKVKSLSRVWLLATPWTTAHQAPPSMGFSRQEDWSGVPLPSPQKKELEGSKMGGRIISTVDNSGTILIFLCVHRLIFQLLKKKIYMEFSGGPVVKNPPCNAGTVGWTPGWGIKIPHATRQLSPHTSTTEPSHHN